jgi:predicted Zn-dependent protease
MEEPAKAVQVLETAVFARPNDGVAWAELGRAYRSTGRNAEAATALARGIDLGCTETWVWHEAGQAAATLGDMEGLERAHRELKDRDVRLARALELRLPALACERGADAGASDAGCPEPPDTVSPC